VCAAGYRSAVIGNASITFCSSSISSSVNCSILLFITMRSPFVDPGMGIPPCRATHAIEICDVVRSLRVAIFSTAATSLEFWSKASGLKRGNMLRMSLGRSSIVRYFPASQPRPTGLYASTGMDTRCCQRLQLISRCVGDIRSWHVSMIPFLRGSGVNKLSSISTAAIGCTAWALRIVVALTSLRPTPPILPSLTRSARAFIDVSIGVVRSTLRVFQPENSNAVRRELTLPTQIHRSAWYPLILQVPAQQRSECLQHRL
jgi:hypothetical protein